VTSTVLDVGVFLLCVSASVGTLFAAGPGSAPSPDAEATATRIATETGAVTVAVPGENESRERRHQATLATLLGRAVTVQSAPDSGEPGDGHAATYVEGVVDLVDDRIGPRTRVAARSTEDSAELTVGPKPPQAAHVAVAEFTVPVGSPPTNVRIVVQRWSHA